MKPKTYKVVISGMAGIFPECDNVEELEHKLMNKEDMITIDDRKWSPGELGVSPAIGKFKRIITIDHNFYAVNNKLYQVMDPSAAQYLKSSFEAICDAGVNPYDLSASNTAVIMSSFINEKENLIGLLEMNQLLLGRSRNMQSNRVSFYLNLRGPSYTVDASWNGGIQALQIAYELISSGQCNAALIGACNTIFGPELSFHYQAMGKLNKDGKTKCFTADADGYTRSEACSVFFLQRAEDAKRIYGNVLSVISSDYGTRTTSFTDFCPDQYRKVLKEAYQDAQIDPSEVSYLEADGSASKVMDALELNCIAEIMCANRKTPLPVGSIKSNVGHTEAASSLVSLTKALIALKTGIIPPNLHYSSPNPDVPALLSGQLKVITEPTPLKGDIVAVSSVGLSGTYGHVIIKGNRKIKPQVSSINLPWLFLISGRTEQDLKNVIEKVISMPFNEEFIRMSYNIFKKSIKGYSYKGYALLNTDEQEDYEMKEQEVEKRPVWFLFSGMGSQWAGMGAGLMRLPTFAKAIHFCHEVLLPKGFNLLNLIYSTDPNIYDICIMNSFIGIAAIQIGLVDVLRELGIEPDGLVGHSVGELGCAYADGCCTAEQAILSAYARGKASIEANLIKGLMAAIGKGYSEIKDHLPPTIDIACHNSKRSSTISGPVKDVENYVTNIKTNGIFAKLINAKNIAYHSRYIKPAAPIFLDKLKQVIPEPKLRSKRWISSSIPESFWDSDLAKYSSPEYHANNLLSPVLFEEATAHIPERAIVIEIAPHGLLQSIVKQSLITCTNISLVNKYAKDSLVHLFKAIGRLYLEGIAVNVDNLYPKVKCLFSADTPSISQLLTWDNRKGLGSYNFKYQEPYSEFIPITEEQIPKYFNHKINGKHIMSSTALIWKLINIFQKDKKGGLRGRRFQLENLHFKKQMEVSDCLNSEIYIQLQRGSGKFEMSLEKEILMNGEIKVLRIGSNYFKLEECFISDPYLEMTHKEIYKYFEEFSVEFGESFKLIQKVSLNETGMNAIVLWKGEWIEFLDALLMLVSLYDTLQCNELKLINYVRQISIDFNFFQYFKPKEITIFYNRYTKEISCEGLKIQMPLTQICNIIPSVPELLNKNCQFFPYYTEDIDAHCTSFSESLNVILPNVMSLKNNFIHKLIVVFADDADIYGPFRTILQDSSSTNNYQIEIITATSKEILCDLYLNLEEKDNLLIVGELPFYERVLKCLKKVKYGFLLLNLPSDIYKWNPVYPIMKLNDNNNNMYLLYKVSYREKLYKNLVNVNKINWKSELKLNLKCETLKSTSDDVALVIGKMKSLYSIHEVVRYCLNLENSHIIRFIFYDDKSPPFSLDQPFYKEQIIKDLLINICINNTWGCLKLFTPHTKSIRPAIIDQHQLIYPLSSIKSKNISLSVLGLNLQNVFHHRQELGIFEYCGTDKAGNILCGVGSLTDSQHLVEDEILRWQKAPEWSNEEAASIPLYYMTAYYILKELTFKGLPRETILVYNGTIPLSQAIINIALSLGYKVYTTYNTTEERMLILQLFPQIQVDYMLLGDSKSIESLIITQTKGKGIDIIVNTSDNFSILKSLLKCSPLGGFFYQLNKEILTEDHNIGMAKFEENVHFFTIPDNIFLELPTSFKEFLQKEVEHGIKEGHVKPLQTYCISATSLNIDAIDALKNNENKDKKKIIYKCVNNEDVNIEKSLFICSAEKSYVIICDGNSFFIDLISWLINRGAKTIYVLTEQQLNQSTSIRLKGVMSNYPSTEITLLSNMILTVRDEMNNILKNLSTVKEISEIFIIGKEMENKVHIIESLLIEMNYSCKIIYIGNITESLCETKIVDILPALAISCQSHHMKAISILPLLDRFAENRSDKSIIFLEEDIKISRSNERNKYLQRIPEDATDLLALSKKSMPKACFVETMTLCPQYKYNKEVSPIFVIPGLKPHQMDKLTSRLFYPTFEARLPQDIDDIESVAKQLHEDLKRFKFKIFTLITNDWGGALGLQLAKYLEDDGKIVLMVMLDSSPQTVQNWVQELFKIKDVNLISKYIKVPYEIKKKLYQKSDWEEKVSIALESSVEDEIEREGIKNGLNILKKSVFAIMNYRANGKKFQGKYFMYRPSGSSQNDQCNITEFCERKPIINKITASNHQDMLDDLEMARIINGLIPYEYKTAANETNCEIFGDYLQKGIEGIEGARL